MTTIRQWIGSTDNDPNNPASWSPSGAPQAGDILNMADGTMNLSAGDLAGDTLHVHAATGGTAAPSINVSHHAALNLLLDPTFESTSSPTVNVNGAATVNASLLGSSAVAVSLKENISAHSVLSGSVAVNRGGVVISGPGKFKATGTSTFSNDYQGLIDSDVIGSGTIRISQGSLELGGSVSAGPTFLLNSAGELTIDDPHRFHASITDNGTSAQLERVDLLGIQASSYDFRNDVVRLFEGDTVVDRLRFNPGNGNLYVTDSVTGVTVWDTSAGAPTGALPIHV